MKKSRKIRFPRLVTWMVLISAFVFIAVMAALMYADFGRYVQSSATQSYQSDIAMTTSRLSYFLSKLHTATAMLIENEELIEEVLLHDKNVDTILPRVPIIERIEELLSTYMTDRCVGTVSIISRYGAWSIGAEQILSTTLFELAELLDMDLEAYRDRPGILSVDEELPYAVTRSIRAGSIFYAVSLYDEGAPAALVLVQLNNSILSDEMGRDSRYALYMNDRIVWPKNLFYADEGSWAEAIYAEETGLFALENERGGRVFFKRPEANELAVLLFEDMSYRQGSLNLLLALLCGVLALSALTGVALSRLLISRTMSPVTALIERVRAYRDNRWFEDEASNIQRMDLREKLLLFLMLSVGAPMLVFFGSYSLIGSGLIRNEIVRTYENGFAQGAANLELLLRGQLDLLSEISMDYTVQNALLAGAQDAGSAIAKVVDRYCKLLNERAILQIYDRNRELVYASSELDRQDAFEQYGISSTDTGVTYLGMRRDSLNHLSYGIAVNIRSIIERHGGKNAFLDDLGYVICLIDEMEMERSYLELTNSGRNGIYIVDNRGEIISSANKGAIGKQLSDLSTSGLIRYESPIEGAPLSYCVDYYADDVSGDIRALFIDKAYLMVILYLLLSLALNFFCTRILREIGKLRALADTSDFLDLSSFYDNSSQIAEIDELGKAFNDMKQRIDQLLDDLLRARMNETNLELKRRAAEMHALQMQIRPHFLCNLLQSISSQIKAGDVTSANEAILDLGDLFRASLSRAEPIVALEEEIEYTKAYCSILRRRTHDRIAFEWQVDPEAEKMHMPKLLLQPLIENAVEHAFPGSRRGSITIRCERDCGQLSIAVEDDGVGFDPEGSAEGDSKGIGLKNVRQRIQLYYGEEGTFEVRSEGGFGTVIHVRLPQKNDMEQER